MVAHYEARACEESRSSASTRFTHSTLDGPALTMQFAHQATNVLDEFRLRQLKQFSEEGPRIKDKDMEARAEARLKVELQKIFEEEPRLSGRAADRLGRQYEAASAEIGIILHCQTGRGAAGSFWDETCFSIEALKFKGFREFPLWLRLALAKRTLSFTTRQMLYRWLEQTASTTTRRSLR